jgi:very-short-patch-repair endonuclease
MSLPKGLLWQVLRKRLSGFKFSRQHPIGPYVLDLYCAAAKVVIEVDGESRRMGRRPQHDQTLNGWLTE